MAKVKTGHRRTARGAAKVGGRKRPRIADVRTPEEKEAGKSPVIAARQARAREIILGELRKARSISGACEEAEVSRTQFRKWRTTDAAFAEAVDEALEAGREALEDEAVRRGKNGVRKAIYHQGAIVGYERRYSDRLLETMLAANNPEKFRHNHKVEMAGQLSHTHTDLSLDQLKELAAERGLPTEIFEK